MKRTIISLLVIIVTIVLIVIVAHYRNPSNVQTIGIVQYVHQPLLDETQRGIVARLKELGLDDGKNYFVRTMIANQDIQTTTQILTQFIDEKASLIIAIATPPAQAAAHRIKNTPIVFAAITDPVRAGLVESIQAPGRNLTETEIDGHLKNRLD